MPGENIPNHLIFEGTECSIAEAIGLTGNYPSRATDLDRVRYVIQIVDAVHFLRVNKLVACNLNVHSIRLRRCYSDSGRVPSLITLTPMCCIDVFSNGADKNQLLQLSSLALQVYALFKQIAHLLDASHSIFSML